MAEISSMLHAAMRLIGRSWDNLMLWFSMSTLGFIALSCLFPIILYLALHLIPAYLERSPTKSFVDNVRDNFKKSRRNTLISLGVWGVFWVVGIALGVATTTYNEHQAVVRTAQNLQTSNKVLTGERDEARRERDRLKEENGSLKQKLSEKPTGAPAPTLRDGILAINAHLTKGDRNRFSNALSEFSDSLSQGESLAYKLNAELGSLARGESDGTIAKEVQQHEKVLSDIATEGWKYQKAFPVLRTKWDMFREQNAYIFGDNPDNEGPNAIINASEAYRNYLEWWNIIPNKDQKPILNLLSVEHNESQGYLNTFFKWQRGCVSRLNEMRNSIR